MLEPHQLVIDRITEGTAHLEDADGQALTIPATWLPPSAREGDILDATTAGEDDTRTTTLTINQPATRARREQMSNLRESLQRGPEGNLDL